MKKLISILLATVMCTALLGLTGCAPRDPVEKGATEIIFYAQDFEDWSNEHLREKIREFNSILDDGIQIKMVMYEDAEYTQAMKAARENGVAPEVYMTSYGNLAGEIKRGYPAALNGLLPKESFDDILDYIKDMVCYDENYFGYPQLSEPSSLLFYNKDILKAAGVTKEPALWSFKDLIEACGKIKPTLKKNQYTIGLPAALPLAWATVGLQYNTAGYLPVNDNWDGSTLSETILTPTENYGSENGYANLARLWWDLYGNGFVPAGNVSPTGYNDIIEGLCGNKLAMTFAGSWSVAEIINTYPDYVDKVGIAPLPTINGSKEGVTASNGGWMYCISDSASADKKAKAATFVKWLLCDDAARTASYFERAHYSKAAVTKSVQAYIDTNASADNKAWRDVITDVAAKSISEPLYSFDATLKFADVLSFISINADSAKNATVDSAVISPKLAKAKADINTVISLNNMAGTNPKK